MKIVCGTDFTPNSQEAADVAAALARRLEHSLTLTHVLDEFGVYTATGGIPAEITADATTALNQEGERLRPRGVELSPMLCQGTPDQKIAELAQKGDCSLIVVASLGHRLPERWLLGSVSGRLAEAAPVPVLVVRKNTQLLEWIAGRRTLKVMVCFDGTVSSEAALRWALDLCKVGECDLVASFVDWPVAERMRLGITGSLSLTQNPPEVQEVLEREIAEHVARIAGSTPVKTRVEAGFGRVDAHLVQMAEEEAADVVVIGTHQRRGIDRLWRGSVSRGVLLRAPSSVAVVPASINEAVTIPHVRLVLAATDLAEDARYTIAQACSVIPPGGSLHLLTVMRPQTVPAPIAHYEPETLSKEDHAVEANRRRELLMELVPPTAADRNIRVTAEVMEHERPAAAIIHAAERIGADLICVGASSGGVMAGMLGSVAQNVVRNSLRPVLVARSPIR
jgi:nucleotide-binding universal stress UspA family protein